MDGRQIVLVLTAKFSVLNTEIFRLESKSPPPPPESFKGPPPDPLPPMKSINYLYRRYYYFKSILYYMLYDNIILKLIRKYNIL